MIFGNVMADDVVIDFNSMDITTSSSESTAGDIMEPKTFEQGGVTIVISPKDEEVTSTENRFWSTSKGPQLRCYSGTITISGTNMKTILFANAKWNDGNSASVGSLSAGKWTSEEGQSSVVIKIAGNTQINKITISTEVSGDTPDTPDPSTEPEHQKVTLADLADATDKIANVELTLTDGKVLYAEGARVFVREGDKALLFYSLGIDDLKTNATVTGSIKGKLDIYNSLNEFCKTEYTKADKLVITQSAEAATPLTIDVDDIKKHVSDLVKFTGVIFTDVDGKNGTANVGDKTLPVYDQFSKFLENLTSGVYDLTGIVTVYKDKYQIYPTSIVMTSGVDALKVKADANAPAYNLAGQKVDEGYKGLVIKGSKKMIQK